jgi:hypothetical protein
LQTPKFDRPIGFVERRIGHPRLIRRWLKAGVMDGKEWT